MGYDVSDKLKKLSTRIRPYLRLKLKFQLNLTQPPNKTNLRH